MEHNIQQTILDHSDALFGRPIDAAMVQFQKTKKEFAGDITLVLFPFLKLAGKSPQELGATIGNLLRDQAQLISNYSVVGGFLNLEFAESYWLDQLRAIDAADQFGYCTPNSKPAIMVEYSSPNTNKPLHLGHLRNNFLGFAVAETLKAYGHEVIKTQIINDRGIHICKSMLAWQEFSPVNAQGERETPANTGIKGDKLVGKYYVEFDKRFNEEAKTILAQWESGHFEGFADATVEKYHELTAALEGKDEKAQGAIRDKIKDLAKNETTLLKAAKDMLVRWEARDPETYLLWTTMNGWVYEGFNATYEKMGVDFDRLYYESETFILGKDLVHEGLEKGVFYRKDDGSVWIDLTDDGLDHKLLLRSDGTSVYITQDVGTAVDRFNDYPQLTRIIYTVGNEQEYHFKVLFLILKKLGYSWSETCHHLSYGMVELPKGMGRMKSREGTVVDADELMEDVIDAAEEMTSDRGHIDGMTDEEKRQLFETIGLGGLKYFLLKVDAKKKIVYDPRESIELNGHTGPFIQYAHARIQSLLRKLGPVTDFEATDLFDAEKELIKQLADYPKIIEEAALHYAPSLIANYCFELVKRYNQFYQNISISQESDPDKRTMRLVISRNVAKVIKSAMQCLGIDVPDRM